MVDQPLEAQVGVALLERGWTVGAAESCTGGLVLHRLTNVAGSSAYVQGGIVAYANAIKIALLGVDEATLNTYGAVSEPTAAAMARGLRTRLGVDIAVSVTGVAGPGGGTADKPVGLVYVGAAFPVGANERVIVRRHLHPGDREAVKAASADAALRLLLDAVRGALDE